MAEYIVIQTSDGRFEPQFLFKVYDPSGAFVMSSEIPITVSITTQFFERSRGRFYTNGAFLSTLRTFDGADLSVLGSFVWDLADPSSGRNIARYSNGDWLLRLSIGSESDPNPVKFNADGAVIQNYNAGTTGDMAFDEDGNIAYFTDSGGGNNFIRGWDLTTDTSTGTIYTAPSGSGVGGITRASNGDFLFFQTVTNLFKRIDSTGSTVWSVAATLFDGNTQFRPSGLVGSLSADENVFYIGNQQRQAGLGTDQYAYLLAIDASDGSILWNVLVAGGPGSGEFLTGGCENCIAYQVMPNEPYPPGAGTPIPIRKLRRTQTISDEKFWIYYSRFQLDFQSGGPRNGNDPIQICLRYSDDSGNTWSPEMWLEVDNKGEYDRIAQWFRLGRGRSRVWEVSSTSPALTVWLDAYMDAEKGSHG